MREKIKRKKIVKYLKCPHCSYLDIGSLTNKNPERYAYPTICSKCGKDHNITKHNFVDVEIDIEQLALQIYSKMYNFIKKLGSEQEFIGILNRDEKIIYNSKLAKLN